MKHVAQNSAYHHLNSETRRRAKPPMIVDEPDSSQHEGCDDGRPGDGKPSQGGGCGSSKDAKCAG